MGKVNFSDDFKRDAVAQINERGYPVAEVSQRLPKLQAAPHGSCQAVELLLSGRREQQSLMSHRNKNSCLFAVH